MEPKRHLMFLEISQHFLLSSQQNEVFKFVSYAIICTLICLFGIAGNAINVIIFFRQGFDYTVNISLFGLALADLGCLLTQLWVNICFSPLLQADLLSFIPEEVQYLTGTVPSVCFGRINGWIVVLITAERCLGIAMPLKVKQIVTARRTTIIMVVIYLMNIVTISTEYQSYSLVWAFYHERNRTMYGLTMSTEDKGSGILTYIMHVLMGYVSFIAVIVLTTLLVVKLTRNSEWRTAVTSDHNKVATMTSRDRRTVKMVVLIANIMIICYTPFTVIAIAMIVQPEFNLLGKYRATFVSFMSLAFIFQNVNSSVNIFLYYRMSTKYRNTFNHLFDRCIPKHAGPARK